MYFDSLQAAAAHGGPRCLRVGRLPDYAAGDIASDCCPVRRQQRFLRQLAGELKRQQGADQTLERN